MKAQAISLSSALLLGIAGVCLPVRANETDTSPVLIAQSENPITYTTVRSDGGIAMQITDGNFRWHGTLRPGENGHVGSDGVSNVFFTPSLGHVVVYSSETGEEFYNYYINPVDASSNRVAPVVRASTPVTYVTQQNPDQLMVQITEGEFRFRGPLNRTQPSSNMFVGSDRQVRVIYDRDTGRIVVINVVTGTEFYNYFYEVDS